MLLGTIKWWECYNNLAGVREVTVLPMMHGAESSDPGRIIYGGGVVDTWRKGLLLWSVLLLMGVGADWQGRRCNKKGVVKYCAPSFQLSS